jgi:hypothetical protein
MASAKAMPAVKGRHSSFNAQLPLLVQCSRKREQGTPL